MEQEEWSGYVARLAKGAIPLPMEMIKDYSDWRCRSTVGRALFYYKDTEAAMRVLSTVVNVNPNMEDAPEYGLSEAEHKVLCLRDIAEIVWELAHADQAALMYLRQADEIGRAYKHFFRNAVRGEIFYRRLTLLLEIGKEAKAVEEAEAMQAAETTTREGVNSYKYYALRFLAEHEHRQGNDERACELWAEAFKVYPLSERGEQAVAAAGTQSTLAGKIKAYQKCAATKYKHWEKLPELKLRRDL